MTHNSLVANQRAHISLIDRRHLRRVAGRAISKSQQMLSEQQGEPHAVDSLKPYQQLVQLHFLDDGAELVHLPAQYRLLLCR